MLFGINILSTDRRAITEISYYLTGAILEVINAHASPPKRREREKHRTVRVTHCRDSQRALRAKIELGCFVFACLNGSILSLDTFPEFPESVHVKYVQIF